MTDDRETIQPGEIEVEWVPFQDTIRERLEFDLAEIRKLTGGMPADVAAGYESAVLLALGALDALVQRVEAANDLRDGAAALTSVGHGLRLDEPVNVGSLRWVDAAFDLLRAMAR